MKAVPVLAAAFFTVFVGASFPSLRQDWIWFPVSWPDVSEQLAYLFGGWDSTTGIGHFIGYPTDYIILPCITLLKAVVGRDAALLLFVFGIALVIAFGAAALSRRIFAETRAAEIASILFALFNPWVYTKIVAGHEFMLLAYGALFCVLAESLRQPVRRLPMLLLPFVIVQQIQFMAVAICIGVALIVFKRNYWLLIACVILTAPIAIAITLNFDTLVQRPYLLEWQRAQSIALEYAVALAGYSTKYASSMLRYAYWPVVLTALIAVAGYVLTFAGGRQYKAFALIALGSIAALVLSSGTRGPIAAPYSWLVVHAKVTAVYRELYDLLGFTAIGYVTGAAAFCRHVRWGALLYLLSSSIVALSWFAAPPGQYWINYHRYPLATVRCASGTRFALMPAFQPLTFGGNGSGIDPDWFPHAAARFPINTYDPEYPENSALAAYSKTGDASRLAGLGVSCVIGRPYFSSDEKALLGQRVHGLTIAGDARGARSKDISQYIPLLSVAPRAPIVSIGNDFMADGVVSGDINASPLQIVGQQSLDARSGWIDARLAFAQLPDAAQSFGGAFTVSRIPLRVDGAGALLIWIRGALRTSGGALIRGNGGLRWIPLNGQRATVTCFGACEVAAAARAVPQYPANGVRYTHARVSYRRPFPWLIYADARGVPGQLLRFNERFDRYWTARAAGITLQHLRIDGEVNGWSLAGSKNSVTIVNYAAAAVSVAEVAAIGVLLIFVFSSLLSWKGAWR